MRIETLGEMRDLAYTAVDILAQALACHGYNWGGTILCEIDEVIADDEEDIKFVVNEDCNQPEVLPLVEEAKEDEDWRREPWA